MIREIFDNKAETSLTTAHTAGVTTLTVADSSVFTDPATGEFGLATIYDGTGTYEIVKITDVPTGTTLTVTRNIAGTNQAWASGDLVEGLLSKQTMDNLAQRNEGARIVLATNAVDLTSTANDVATFTVGSIYIPTGFRFVPLSCWAVILTSNTVSVDPIIDVGSSTGGNQIVTAQTVTETNQWEYTALTVASNTAVENVYFTVDTGGTATALTGKIFLEGVLIGTT